MVRTALLALLWSSLLWSCSDNSDPVGGDVPTAAEPTDTDATPTDGQADATDPEPGAEPSEPATPQSIVLQAELGEISGEYADTTTTPFRGVALYANDESVTFAVNFPTVPGNYRIEVTGASSGTETATANLHIGTRDLGMLSFSGASASVESVDVDLAAGAPSEQSLTITTVGDDDSWDLFIDRVEIILLSGESSPSGPGPSPSTSEPDEAVATIGLLSDTPVHESRAYRNLFMEWGRTEAEVNARVDAVVDQLFYGNDSQRIYYERGSDEAYFYTVDTDDVRSEGVSYGMMISVQLDMQTEFDKLWTFAKTHMQHQSGGRTGYFAWQVRTDGSHIDSNPAPDGDEYFAMALLMADKRWGSRSGIYDYAGEANYILDHMLNHERLTGNVGVPSLINPNNNQIIFSTEGGAASFTNPSYHLPHFYELFARWAEKDNQRWYDVAAASRQLFKDACHPSTGLAPDYCEFDGTPTGGEHSAFRFDAWRVAMNIALDSYWWNADPWARDTWVSNYLGFFRNQGVSSHVNQFNIDGTGASGDHSPGLVAMNAVAALITDDATTWEFVEEFWNTSPTTGTYRYYDGCMYLFGLLNVTGRFRIIGQ